MSKFTYLLAGIAIGILIAPDKGTNTRASLKSKLKRYAGHADDLVDDASQAVSLTADDLQNQLFRKSDQVEEKFKQEF